MSSTVMKRKLIALTLTIATLLTITLAAAGYWLYQLDARIQERLQKRTYTPPVEFYTAPQRWAVQEKLTHQDLKNRLVAFGYRQRHPNQRVLDGDFAELDHARCAEKISPSSSLDSSVQSCLLFRTRHDNELQLAAFSPTHLVGSWLGLEMQSAPGIQLEPKLFAQYYGKRPVLREIKRLSEYPNHCLHAVLAIEDPAFLEHKGISLRGIARAFYTNIIMRQRAQGGSTITQQLIKNDLLTHEKTLKRKMTEIGMALIFDLRVPKDQILEHYLNIIYMGQKGAYAVSGFGAAAKYYFDKSVEELGLNECSALAAILNSPGLYNPFRKLERMRGRQSLVLKKMVEHGFINTEDRMTAESTPLALAHQTRSNTVAPYYVDAVRRQLKSLGISAEEGIRVYTAMNPEAQAKAQKALSEGLDALEAWFVHLKVKAEKNQPLQGLLIAANPERGEIEALVGGRNYKKYPYNRAVRAHRQVGSIIKPFVYLAALESLDTSGNAYTPISIIRDEQFEYKYDRQVWSPKNYDEEFRGSIPLYFALKSSLNAATAQLGIDIGISSIVGILKRLGIQSKIEALPAMTLGAYELYPREVLAAYTTLARQGSRIPLTLIRSVENLDGETLYKFKPEPEQVTSQETTSVVVGMMKQTILNGTGTVVRKNGFHHPAAGKTGTTSDARDSWFSGFTPHHAATVWVGYDNNDIHGLTGATGAAPIWTKYMKSYASKFPALDFTWPDGVLEKEFSASEQATWGVPNATNTIKLIFRKGNEP